MFGGRTDGHERLAGQPECSETMSGSSAASSSSLCRPRRRTLREKHPAVNLPAAVETELAHVGRERAREPFDNVVITAVIVNPGQDVQRARIGQGTVEPDRQLERSPGVLRGVVGTAGLPARHGEMVPAADADVVAREATDPAGAASLVSARPVTRCGCAESE